MYFMGVTHLRSNCIFLNFRVDTGTGAFSIARPLAKLFKITILISEMIGKKIAILCANFLEQKQTFYDLTFLGVRGTWISESRHSDRKKHT